MTENLEAGALLIIDLQRDYFNPKLWPNSGLPDEAGRLVKAVNARVAAFRERGRPVLWTRQQFRADMGDAFLHAREASRAYCVEGTPGAQLLPGLAILPEDFVITKKRYSAFFGTDLEAHLANLEITRLFLAGITTSWCIRSTATDAYQRDLEVFLYRECLAGFSATDHERDLKAMDGLIASVVGGE